MEHPRWLLHVDLTTEPAYEKRWWALAVISLAILISTVDQTIVNVALPPISQELNASTADLQWVGAAYGIMLAGLVLFANGVADRYGRKPVFLIGFAVFGIGSVLAASARSVLQLIAMRALMGVGAALLFPPALSTLAVIFPPQERGKAISIYAAFAGVGLALGPILGGLLLDRFSWRSVFLVNVPVTIAGIVAGLLVVPNSTKPGTPSLDRVGALLSVAGLGTLLYGIIEGPNAGWQSPVIIAALVVGLALSAVLVLWELRSKTPMFDVRVFRYGGVIAGSLVLFLLYVTFTGIMFLIPQYLQFVLGESPLVAGLALLPLGGVFALIAPFASVFERRFGIRRVLVFGLSCMAAGLIVLSVIDEVSGYLFVLVGCLVYVAGWAPSLGPATTAIMNAVPAAQTGDAASVNQITRQVGGAVGVAVLGTIFTSVYAMRLAGAIETLPRASVKLAESSIGGAAQVADSLGSSARNILLAAADKAFVYGVQVAFIVAAVLTAAGVAVVAMALREQTPRSTTSSSA